MRFLLPQLRVDFKIHCGLTYLHVDFLIPLALAAIRQSIVKHVYSVHYRSNDKYLWVQTGIIEIYVTKSATKSHVVRVMTKQTNHALQQGFRLDRS